MMKDLESLRNYIELNIDYIQDQIQILINRLADVQRELKNLKLLLEIQVFNSTQNTDASSPPPLCSLNNPCPRCEG